MRSDVIEPMTLEGLRARRQCIRRRLCELENRRQDNEPNLDEDIKTTLFELTDANTQLTNFLKEETARHKKM